MQFVLSEKIWNRHLAWLMLGISVPALAGLLVVLDEGKVGFFFLPEYPLPTVCYARMVFDKGCPGCGLTRSFVHLMHGDLTASLAMHRFGWLIFACLVVQIPLRIWTLFGGKFHFFSSAGSKALLGISFVGLLLLNWILNLISLI